MNEPIIGVIAIIALVFVLWIITKILGSIKPASKKEIIQYKINRMASMSEGEHAYALGKSAKEASKNRSCLGRVFFFIILGIIALFILMNIGKGF